MLSTWTGLLDQPILQTPVAVLDFETTGMRAGWDRVVEVSVVRFDPGQPMNLVLDTLVQPDRRMAATEIHGITDADVANAPRFADIAGNLVEALAGCVLAAYNVSFDLRFLQEELSRVGVRQGIPHLCLMYLRPMLNLGRMCSLDRACRAHQIRHPGFHAAATDAVAAAFLWEQYLENLRLRQVRTFRDLAQVKNYKFTRSFSHDPYGPNLTTGLRRSTALKSRWLNGRRPS